jgi:hypothetical protein
MTPTGQINPEHGPPPAPEKPRLYFAIPGPDEKTASIELTGGQIADILNVLEQIQIPTRMARGYLACFDTLKDGLELLRAEFVAPPPAPEDFGDD